MGKGPNISKNARDLCREHGLDLGQIKGTGNGGQITVTDVKKHLENLKEASPSSPDSGVDPPGTPPSEGNASPAAGEPLVDGSAPRPTPDAGTPPPPPEEALEPKKGERRPVARILSNGAWECPFDGHTQLGTSECQRCGAEREGSEVVRT